MNYVSLVICKMTFLLAVQAWAVDMPVSQDFTVSVDKLDQVVYVADCGNDSGGSYSFVQCHIEGKAQVVISSVRAIESLRIRPEALGLTAEISGNVATLTLDRPQHVVIEVDGIQRPLFLFVDEKESDAPTASGRRVMFFGPGVHRPERGRVYLNEDTLVYLAHGAVVKAAFFAREVDRVRIVGPGIIDGSDWAHREGPFGNLLNFFECNDVSIEGVILRGSFATGIHMLGCSKVRISGVKILGGRTDSDDGIHLWNCRDVDIERCFIRTNADCIAIKGKNDDLRRPVQNITIKNMTLWGDRNRICAVGHESRTEGFFNIQLLDWNVLRASGPVLLLEPGEATLMSKIRVERWSVDVRNGLEGDAMRIRPLVNEYMLLQEPGHLQKITLKEIAFEGSGASAPRIQIVGADAQHRIQGMVVSDLSYNNAALPPESVTVGQFVDGFVREKSKVKKSLAR